MRSLTETEAEFQDKIIELAHLTGWRVAHFRPARTLHSWRTPVSADGAGFPDLVMVKGDELIVAEIKSQKGKVTEKEKDWLGAFQLTCAKVYEWRPSDWNEVVAVLQGKLAPEVK